MQQLKLGGILLPQQIIDLSTPMEKNNGEIAKFKMKQTKHKEGGDLFGRRQAFSRKETLKQTLLSIYHYLTGQRRITSKTFPDREFLNQEIITASTHTATHFDAPLHFGSESERKPAPSIDEIPVEWCFGDGVLLDMRFKEPGEFITSADIDHELRRIQYELKPLDIVIIWTGAEQYWGKKEYLYKYPGMSREATSYLIDRGIKIICIDSYGFDRPFKNMMYDYFTTLDNHYLFPAHFFGREKCYCHVERLMNLGLIPKPYGFKISCLPIKIKGAGASWSRVVAIIT